jgi:gamma-glutamylcyclotransferase
MAAMSKKHESENNTVPLFYYFAYGADMNKMQVLSLGVKPVVVGIAKLTDHRLAFHGYSRTWDGAMETVVPAPGQEVWGVIYELTAADWDRLDTWHDVRWDGTGTYFHFPTQVTDLGGKTYPVLLYKKDILREPQPPSQEYLEVIFEGALDHDLPREYLDVLRGLKTRPAAFPVPREGKGGYEQLGGLSCSGCAEPAAEQD